MALPPFVRPAPLVPAAVAATAGVVADRADLLSAPAALIVTSAGLAGFFAGRGRLASAALLAFAFGAGAAWHDVRLGRPPADDIGFAVADEPRLARLRGRLVDEPSIDRPAPGDPLRRLPDAARTHALLDVEALADDGDRPASGRVSLRLAGAKSHLHAGDRVEVTGWLSAPRPPDNPGERDRRRELLDDGIRAVMTVQHTAEPTAAEPPAEWSPAVWLVQARVWARRQLQATLPPEEAGLAAALLLGDGSALGRADWDRFIRTGVVHVLTVSGQHLVVLAGFFWLVLRVPGISRRRGSVLIAVALVLYGLLTGFRPPVARAVVMVVAVCGAFWVRRVAQPANTFALAWLLVLALNPANVSDPGTLLSFLCVAVLIWGTENWFRPRETDPLQRLFDASRPAMVRWSLRLGRVVLVAYAVTFVLGVALMPLTAYCFNMIAPVGILIGPPAVALASVALVAGFLQLLLAAVWLPLAFAIGGVTRWSLWALATLVDWADRLPYGHVNLAAPDATWLIGFYVVVGLALWWPAANRRPAWCAAGVLGWVAVGLAASLDRAPPDGLRVTLLAVGHGGATVLETPDGRVLLVDCGAMAGPEITRRVVAPYLWHRGASRVDEVFLTHGDLDHFNGLPALLERFAVGRVSITPSFFDKPSPGVREVERELLRRGTPTRRIAAGTRLSAGAVEIDVLHPPADGPPGPENARSLVLAVRHAGHCIMLTGDLDLAGRSQLLAQPPPRPIDVWMAPHHGGRGANPPELAAWARPEIAVAHNGFQEAEAAGRVYESAGARFLGTWPCGAVTIVSRTSGLSVETVHAPRRVRHSESPGAVVRAE
jgi:competence protein ComEC